MANTLTQTAFLKPKITKTDTFQTYFYTGQLTTPGPGVPPSLIFGAGSCRFYVKQKNFSPMDAKQLFDDVSQRASQQNN